MAAAEAGVTLTTFTDAREFLAALPFFPKETPIYLDAQLSHGLRGEMIAREAYALGYVALYLATGLPADSLPRYPWIRQVVGKDPPWK